MLGSLGAGTSRLARRLTTILPAMTLPEALETTRLHRVAGRTDDRAAVVTTRPFRAPHHTISDVGLIGGGQVPMPGEVSRAHHGVLFLDELPEFKRHVLEVLRQPLADSLTRIEFRGHTACEYFRSMSSKGDERKRCESTVAARHERSGDVTRMYPTAEAVLWPALHRSPTGAGI